MSAALVAEPTAVIEMAAVKLVEAGLGWAVGRLGDAAVKRTYTNRAARAELVEIATEGIATALAIAPEIESALGSQAYATKVLCPALLEVLGRRTIDIDADDLAAGFLRRFVEPYLRGRPTDDVLANVFRLEPERLQRAFAAMATTLRSAFLRSEYWREPVQGAALDELLLRVTDIQARLPPQMSSGAALEAARKDARAGSEGLRSWPQTIGRLHIERPEAEMLRRQVLEHPGETTLLIGVAGSGKSALLAGLVERLEADGLTVFALKADQLPPDVANFEEISRALGMKRPLDEEIEALATAEPVALIIDQLDAVSEVMDRSGGRMRLLLNLVRRLGSDQDGAPPVHVIVSSRPFEARYDARFETLDAKAFTLDLPPYERVEALLRELEIDPAIVPQRLQAALRRPFLLKLFVQLVQRGAVAANLVEGELLNTWLASAPLGDEASRRTVVELLQAMAHEMTATETLWRPADRFDADWPEAVRRAEACDLIVRDAGRLGFAHQAWLDDFQARRFATAASLADYALSVQDGLFNRATILRALERLRATDRSAYADALDLLLGGARTRRHLRHLIVDLIASQSAPLPREVAWIRRLLQDDAALARRAVASIVGRWAGWRPALLPMIPLTLATDGLAHSAGAMVVAEAKLDQDAAEALLLRFWPAAERDYQAFEIAYRARLWTDGVRRRLERVFAQGELANWAVASFLVDLVEDGRPEAALDLLVTCLNAIPYGRNATIAFHDLEKLVVAIPRRFAEGVLPWFVQIIGEPEQIEGVRDQYPHSENLPVGWQDPHEEGTVFAALRTALELTAATEPEAFLRLVAQVEHLQVEEVQALIADGFAAGAASLADEGLAWLLRDRRRFLLGQAHVEDDRGVGHMAYDWSTRALLAAAAPHARKDVLERVRDAIEAWDGYSHWVWKEDGPDLRRQRRQWAAARRAVFLDLLPADLLTPRRSRQVIELLRTEPRLRGRGRRLLSAVTSPMSADAMAKAGDDEIMGMLNATPDGADRFRRANRRVGDGGYVEVARAFAAFGLQHPARALRLVRERFEMGRHEYAAGEVIQKLAERGEVDDAELIAVTRALLDRGFGSEDFRRDAAWALQAAAQRLGGLQSSELDLLEAWIVKDPAVIAARIQRTRLHAEKDAERNAKKEPPKPHPILFGRGLGGLSLLPGGNYTFLSALAAGLLARDPPDAQAWLAVLERHAARAEEPGVWSALLPRYGPALFDLERDRVRDFFDTLWRTSPEAFDRPAEGFLWTYRELLPDHVRSAIVQRWLSEPDAGARQLGGEYAMALAIVEGEARDLQYAALASGDETPENLGRAFTVAAAWREDDLELRRETHSVLMTVASTARGSIADALATLVPFRHPLPPDAATRDLLGAAACNDALLTALFGHAFIDALQGLLLEAGFEELVLAVCERIVDVTMSGDGRIGGLTSRELVALAVALQRGPDDQRRRAMTLYERLLDGGAYGADEAAKATLQR